MKEGDPSPTSHPPHRPGGRGVAWIIALALLLVLAATVWRVADLLGDRGASAIGDGKSVESYRFDLSTLLVDRRLLVAAGIPRDGVPVLDRPGSITGDQVDSLSHNRRTKYLVASDRVIGVVLGDEARAYPIRAMNWHEVVNDTLDGRAIGVTYSPLCDAVVVFDRNVDGRVLRFGVSGLLYNSNLVLYDDASESLWSQLMASAIAGPAAAERDSLLLLPCALVRWDRWRRDYPGTTVLAPDPQMLERYRRSPYGSYEGSDLLRFPVDPMPPEEGPPTKERIVIVDAGGRRSNFTWATIAEMAGSDGTWETALGDETIVFSACEDPVSVSVEVRSKETPWAVRYSYWFAWHAISEGEATRGR